MTVSIEEPGIHGNGISFLNELCQDVSSICSEPDRYIEPTESMRKEVLSLSKKMYDFMKEFETFKNQNSLNELLVSGFDNEQIWQQIQLQNNPSLTKFKNSQKNLVVSDVTLGSQKKEKPKEKKKKKRKNTHEPDEDLVKEEDFEHSNELFVLEQENEDEILIPRKKFKKTVVDDQFFQLREMEEYMDKLDQEEMKNDGNDKVDDDDDDVNDESESDGDIDFFKSPSDIDDDDSINNFQYCDFFDPPIKAKVNSVIKEDANDNDNVINKGSSEVDEDGPDDDDDDDNNEDGSSAGEESEGEGDSAEEGEYEDTLDKDEEEEDNNNIIDHLKGEKDLSSFEKKQRQMQEKIKKLEEENVSEKPWQLMGEATAKKRPVNSLLEEFVTFDHTSVGAPVVTEETTLTLEEMILQRIKDRSWNDVIRKEKPVVQPHEYKRAPELDHEKSKLNLAEVYEKEYLKQAEGEKEEKENEEHVHIQNLMDRLFFQLDSLSNFHFTPKPPQPEIKIITNVPSLQMEEVLPVNVNEASQLAPEEIYDKKKGDLVHADEKTDGDRKRERRQKKVRKRTSAKERERKAKLKAQKSGKAPKSDHQQAMDTLKKGVRSTIVNKNSNEKKTVKSSNEFFSKLQDEVKKNISKESSKGKKGTTVKKTKSAESLKL